MGDMMQAVGRGSVSPKGLRTRSRPCLGCGADVQVTRDWTHYCSDACRAEAWRRRRSDYQPEQARMDFTPAASELAHAVRRRETKAQRILARPREGPATTWNLASVGGIRFGARLQELEARGLRYEREDHADYSVYTMTQEPRGE